MILICENCQVRYLVPAHALGQEGRRVRCGACNHEWFQPPEGEETFGDRNMPEHEIEPIPESVRPIPERESTLSLLKPQKKAAMPADQKARLIGYAAAACIILAILGGSIPIRARVASLWPPVAGFYMMLGLQTPVPGEGLVFDHIKATEGTNDKGGRIVKVEGRIINLKSGSVTVPPVIASLKMADGSELGRWAVTLDKQTLKGQEDLPFSTSYPVQAGEMGDVTIRFVMRW